MAQTEPVGIAEELGLLPKMIRRLLQPAALAVIALHLSLVLIGAWALRSVLPDSLTLNLFGHAHVVADLHQRLLGRVVEAGFLLPGVFLLEYLWVGWEDCSVRQLLVRRSASMRTDIVCYLFEMAPGSALVCGVMSLGVSYISGAWIRQLIAQATGVDPSIAGTPLALQAALLFFLYTLLDYWNHRLDHTRLFWPLHRFHHAAEEFAVVTAARVHPAAFTAVVGSTLPAVLLDADFAAMADTGIFIVVLRLIVHSRIDSDFGWVGRWALQSPRHHRLHHSLNRMPVNLGLLPLWDRLFDTWRDAPRTAMRIGTPTPYRHGAFVLPDLWRDYCEFWSGIQTLAGPGSRRPGWDSGLGSGLRLAPLCVIGALMASPASAGLDSRARRDAWIQKETWLAHRQPGAGARSEPERASDRL